jgi:DNA end-binding protein Ku
MISFTQKRKRVQKSAVRRKSYGRYYSSRNGLAKFEDHYEEALTELINAKRNGRMIGSKPRPRADNVVNLMDALRQSISGEASSKGKKPRKAVAGQKEMLLPIEGKRRAEKKAAKPELASGRRKVG